MFLSALEITFRRDPTNYRPRINKVRRPLWCGVQAYKDFNASHTY